MNQLLLITILFYHHKLLSMIHSRITIHFSTCLFTNIESMIIKDGRFISVIQSGNITISMIPVLQSQFQQYPLISHRIRHQLTVTGSRSHWSSHLNHSLIIQVICELVIQWLSQWWLYSAKIRCRTGVGTMAFPPQLLVSTGIHESCGRWPLWVTESWGMFGTVSASAPLTENDGTPFPPQLSISTGIHESCGPRQSWLTG